MRRGEAKRSARPNGCGTGSYAAVRSRSLLLIEERCELRLKERECGRRQLLRVLADLPVEVGVVVRVEAALEDHGVGRAIMEPGSDAQGVDAITHPECFADLLRL